MRRLNSKRWFRLMAATGFNSKRIAFGERNTFFFLWGWRTADLLDADILFDLRKLRLPLPDASVQFLSASMVLEHVRDTHISNLFKEFHRILTKTGVSRIIVPDMDLVIAAYREKEWSFFRHYLLSFADPVSRGILPEEQLQMHNIFIQFFASYSGRLDTSGGPIVPKEVVDRKLNELNKYEFAAWCVDQLEEGRIYAHVNAFDFEKIEKLAIENGFSHVERSQYLDSRYGALRKNAIDRLWHDYMALYVDIVK